VTTSWSTKLRINAYLDLHDAAESAGPERAPTT